MFLFSSRRTIPLNELPSGSLKPDILPVWPFCINVSTCFWVSFLPCISIGIRKSQDFRYRVHPQAVFPFTISPCPHLGHFNTTAIFSLFSFFPVFPVVDGDRFVFCERDRVADGVPSFRDGGNSCDVIILLQCVDDCLHG